MSLTNRHLIVLSAIGLVAVSAVGLLARQARPAALLGSGDLSVSCAPSQRALVRHATDGATPRIEVACADDPAVAPGAASGARFVPATFNRSVRAAGSAPVQTVRPAAASRASATAAQRDGRPSWQKRALIIGGSAGAGAGIGALAGGRKGALIGLAIGGGGAAILDQLKNK